MSTPTACSAPSSRLFLLIATLSLLHAATAFLVPRAPMRTPTCGRLSAAAAAAVEDVPAPMASLLSRLPEGGVMFNDVMKAIDECGFEYSPVPFVNGPVKNDAGTNEGSAKLLSMGMMLGLSEEELLQCWGEHFRGVLDDPQGTSHANIRAFIKTGWAGVSFPQGLALRQPPSSS